MPTERNALRLGITTLVVLILFFTAIIYIGDSSFDTRVPIVVLVKHDLKIPRIKAGAPIICGPQQVGVVTSVKSVERPTSPPRLGDTDLYFEIDGKVNAVIDLRVDCRIAVEGQILGDQGQLTIEHRGTDSKRASPAHPIEARAIGFASDLAMITSQFDEQDPKSLISQIKSQLDTTSPASFVAKVHGILDDIKNVVFNLKQTVDPSVQTALVNKIGSILDHINTITATLDRQFSTDDDRMMLSKIHHSLDLIDRTLATVADTIDENRSDVRSTVAAVKGVATKLDRKVVPAVQNELNVANGSGLLAKTHAAFNTLNQSLDDVSVVTHKAKRIATLSEDRILTLVQNAKAASEHLKAATKNLRLHPWTLIHQPTATESKQKFILDAVREFSDASAHLDDCIGQLHAMLEAESGHLDDDDPTLQAIKKEIKSAADRFGKTEKMLWQQLDMH